MKAQNPNPRLHDHSSMTAEPTEARLIARVRAGDADALAELYRNFADQVYDTALRLTASKDDAEDVLQNVFIGLPDVLGGYTGSGTLGAWIRRIAHRTALGFMRQNKRLLMRERKFGRQRPAGEAPATVEAKLTLEWALRRMPDDLRVVYVLKEIEGYSHDEIAGLLGLSASASAVRLHRARGFLKRRLEGKI